jgi:rod shape-determining protein MreB
MGLFTKEIAIDLGTANTIIIYNDKVVVDEPSIVAIERSSGKIIAVGKRAQMMHGKTHENIKTIRPLRGGVIADFQAAEHMIRAMIKMIDLRKSWFPPALKMVICIPSGITEVEERAVKDSAEQAGAKEVRLIHEPMAAAIGIGIDVLEPVGNMVIDIGGGTSEIAVIALGGIVNNKSIRIAGDEFNADIKNTCASSIISMSGNAPLNGSRSKWAPPSPTSTIPRPIIPFTGATSSPVSLRR